jgi:tetratricopeptide (TPR) repeat protein
MLSWQSCSTKRDRWVNRTYHNITAKFNGYFNGEELIKESWAMLDAKHIDNFSIILQVYRRGTLEDSKTIYPNADKAIKKASVVIRRHSMMIKGKERNKYIDDAYQLIGKSHFIKRDYYASLEMFTYVVREYVKNHKKDPIFFTANTWLMRAYSELGMYSDAQMAIDRIVNEKNVPQKARGDFLMAYTDFFLKQNNFERAQKMAAESVPYIRNRKKRARMMYINAQLLQKAERFKEASDVYHKVLKLNPPFDMAFNAKINIARCFDVNSGNSLEVRQTLQKMIKEEKHRDFLDQIYFTLGELDQKEEKIPKAIENYNLSIRNSTINTNQKGLSHLAIADIYFDETEYKLSAAQYDSAVTFISKEYPGYKMILNKQESLAELVKHYNTIQYNDSILRMSNLSEDALDKLIDEIIAREKEEQRIQAEKAAAAAAMAAQGQQGGGSFMPPGGAGAGALWYFYNPSAMSSGFKNFKEVFGERKLEDNWRRSKKQIVIETKQDDEYGDDELEVKEEEEKLSPEDSLKLVRQKYKDNLPTTDEAKEACMDSIVDAYYDLGLVYKEKLKDLRKAAETYEELNKKYPVNKFKVTAYYQLFRIYLAMQNQTEADKYKNLILTKYPDSEYAKLISNPDFFAQMAKSKKESDEFYSESFRMYQAGLYQQVIDRCRTAPMKFVDSELLPKFAYLKALALGKQKDVDAFRAALQDVVSLFPGDTLRVQAKALLEVLDRAQGIVPEKTDTAVVEVEQIFTYVSDTTHYFGIWIKDKKLNTNNLKIALSDFNNSYYSLLKLQVGTNFVDPVNQLIVIREFPNAKKATEYLNTLSGTADVTDYIKFDKMDLLLISARNFNKIMKEKNIEEYFKYYKKVYQ